MVQVVKMDILVAFYQNLSAGVPVTICHQTNCTSNRVSGLANTLFTEFPVLKDIKPRNALYGTNVLTCVDNANPNAMGYVANMYAQLKGGKTTNYDDRIKAFRKCLYDLRDHDSQLLFPHRIGCDLAGGEWHIYERQIVSFADRYDKQVVICMLP